MDNNIDSNSVYSDSPVNEQTDNEASKAKEEKQASHVTSHKKEAIENDENDQLLRRVADPEALESVHKYAKRIKSFLGWEGLLEERGNDRSESVVGNAEKNDVEELVCDYSEVKNSDNADAEENSLGTSASEREKVDSNVEKESEVINESDFIDKTFENETERMDPYDGETKNRETEGNGEQCSLSKGDASLENEIGEVNKSDSIDISSENETETRELDELISETKNNDTEQDSHKKVDTSLENYCNMSESIDYPPENDSCLIGNGKVFLETEETNKSDQDKFETTEDGIKHDCQDMYKKAENGIKSDCKVKTNSINIDSEYKVDVIENNDELPKTDEALQVKASENSKTDQNVGNPSGMDQDLGSRESVSSEIQHKKIMNELEGNRKDDINDEFRSSVDDKLSCIDTTGLVDDKDEDIYEKNIQSNDTSLKNSIEQSEIEQISKSEDSLCLDENILMENNIDRPLMAEIRRLSMGIVKDVIESARNSAHEIFASKSEETREMMTNDDQTEYRYSNGNKCSEENSPEKNNDHMTKDSKLDVNYLNSTSYRNFEPFETKDMESETKPTDRKDSIADDNPVCGFGCFKPRWIQKYSTPRVYLTLFSIIGIIHGCYYAYFVSIISTLEKRYAFGTKISGTLLLADEITPLVLGVIVGYIGSRTHRPRMVAIGMFMSAACCFLSGLPYLIYGTAKHLSFIKYTNETGPEACDAETKSEGCDIDDAPPTLTVVGIFLLASFLKGFATLSYYVIGISYMDDNIKKKNSPMYLAIALALRLVGPLVGFLMSSAFLKLYESPTVDPGYGPDDPRWIGAWWIGFFLQGVLLVIFTLPIALFPRRLPGQRRVEKYTAPSNEDGLKKLFQGLFSALKRLGTNPVFVLMIVNTNMKVFGHFGHSIMLPKYMENQFRLSASEASLYSGATSITFVMLSTIIGGCLIWKFRPTIKVLLGGMIVSETLLCVGFLILIIPRCHTVDMVNFGMSDEGLILNGVCNEKCDCSTTSYTPFCGPEGTTYFSPCYAGCTQEIASSMIPKHKEFRNCSCVVFSAADKNLASSIYEGVCPDEKCWSQAIIYLIIYFFLLITSNAFTVAHSMILLRSVHPSDKTIALGTFETFICLFGFIPFPVAFGALVDSACLVWEKSCGEVGNCWFYDMKKYSYLLHGVGSLFCSFSVMCLIGLYFLSPRVRDLYADEEEEIVDIKLDTVSGSSTRL